MDSTNPALRRRDFLTGATAAVIGPSLVRGSQANSVIRLGLIGCGGRGSWIAGLFEKTGNYRVVACADYYQDRLDAFGERFKIEPSRRFTTLSGYKRLLEQPLDAVVIESPPYFHPQQAADAVDAGKHVYLAKPIAVDVPGCLTVEAAGRKAAERKQVFLVDFQTRANDIFIEALRRVHAGAIGRLISAQASYLWASQVHNAPLPSPEERLRFWYQDRALCGDIIVEQDIHALDVACWFAGADPLRAVGNCGRANRRYGQVMDHFAVNFTFPGEFVVSFLSQKGVPTIPDEIRCRIFGSDGVADTDYSGRVYITGKEPFPGGASPDIYAAGAARNIETFHACITAGRFENATVPPSVRSNLTCILGRTAAYRNREVTWKELLQSNEPLRPDLMGLKS